MSQKDSFPLLTIYRGDSVTQQIQLRKNDTNIDLGSGLLDISLTLRNDPSFQELFQQFSKSNGAISVDEGGLRGTIALYMKPHQTAKLLAQTLVDLDLVVSKKGSTETTVIASVEAGSKILADVSGLDGVYVGQLITGESIAENTLVEAIDAQNSTITMSKEAVGTGSSDTLTLSAVMRQTYRVPKSVSIVDRAT